MSTQTNLCTEAACLQSSSQILWNLAPDYKKYDPCTQFEEMVCYGFRERNARDLEDLTVEQGYNWMVEQIILESDYNFAASYTSSIKRSENVTALDEANFLKIQQSYDACMNTDAITKAGIEPLLEFIAGIGELFPVKDGDSSLLTKDDYSSLQAAILYLETYGVSTFSELVVTTDPGNSSETAIILGNYSPSLTKTSIYEDSDSLETYEAVIEAVFKGVANASGSSISDKDAAALAAGIVQFELLVINATSQPAVVAEGSRTGHQLSITEVEKRAPVLSYTTILTGLLPKDTKLSVVKLDSPTLLQAVGDLVTQTPKATLQALLVWRAIMDLGTAIDSTVLAPIQKVQPTSKATGKDRARSCVASVSTTLRFIMGRFYISSSFSANKRNVASRMLTDIRSQFVKRIQSLSWMSDSVKERAVAKVNNIQQNIGYPTSPGSELELLDPTEIYELYESQNVTDSYFGNQLTYRKWNVAFAASKVGKPVDRGEFTNALDVVNAYYTPVGNNIFILAGIMQGATFDPELPWYASYGGLGAILGHELTHGFDNNGRLYNENGTYASWWDNATIAEFNKRAQCFVDQYDNFTYPGTNGPVKVDGKNTLGENLADAGGLHTAFDAWMNNRAALELTLPGLDMFTHEQLFYVFYANQWCSNYSPATAQALYPVDEHAAPGVRIQGMTQNSRGFREAFNCPVKEPVCELW